MRASTLRVPGRVTIMFRKQKGGTSRRGTATVEFAILLPLLLTMMLGTIEFGNALNASKRMISAAKSGARFASMDWTDKLAEGETPNQKVLQDVRNFLDASGLPGDAATVTITHAEGNGEFDLSDPDNNLELFRVEILLPYNAISVFPNNFFGARVLREAIVQRAGQSTLSD